MGIWSNALRIAFYKSSDDMILNWNTHVLRMDHMFSMTLMSADCGDHSLRRQIFFFSEYNIVDRDVWHGAILHKDWVVGIHISSRPSSKTAWYAVESNRVGHLMRILLPSPFMAHHIKINLLKNRIFFIIYGVRKKYILSPVCQKTRWE